MKHDVAACLEGGHRLLRIAAAQGLHRQVIGHQQAPETDLLADDGADHLLRLRGWEMRVDVGVNDMRRHRHRSIGHGREGRKVDRFEIGALRINDGKFQMAVGLGAAVSGNVLDDGKHPAIGKTRGMGTGKGHDGFDTVRIGPAANDFMGARLRNIQHRHAIGRDPGLEQIFRHQTADIAGSPQSSQAATAVGLAIGPRRRIFWPAIAWRPKALNPATFLINEDRRVAAAHCGTE